MKRRILAMALFAVMVLSLLPIVQAAPSTGQIVKLELANQSKALSGSSTQSGNVTINNPSGSLPTMKITTAYADITKSQQTYYEKEIAKFNVFANIFVAEYASGTDVPKNDAEWLDLARKSINLDSFRVNGDKINVNKTVQKNGNSQPAVKVNTSKDPTTGKTSLYLEVFVGEFTTAGETKTQNYTLSWPVYSGMFSYEMRVEYAGYTASDKAAKPLYVKPAHTGDDGLYNVYITNGVMFIDYAQDINYGSGYSPNPAIPVKFTFYEDAAASVRVPKSGELAYVRATGDTKQTTSGNYASGQFFTDIKIDNARVYYENIVTLANNGLSIQKTDGATAYNSDPTVLGVWLPNERNGNTNRTMRIRLEGKDYAYQTNDIKVVFRPLPRNQITTAVLVERMLTIAVGESKKLTIESASATTYNNIRLQEVSSTRSRLYIDGLTITGITVGTAQLQVTASGRVIDQITVNVVAQSTTQPAPTPKPDNQWRVLARRLNVRTGPGTSYPVVGTALMNQILSGIDQGNGWVRLTDGRYVSKGYLAPINTYNSLGTYAVTASALNVRTGPGSSYAKARTALPKGTIVTVQEIAYGWANIGSGWVSMNYLK